MGFFYYVQQIAGQFRAANSGQVFDGLSMANRLTLLTQFDIAVSVVLALSAMAMTFRSQS
jgi:hypothetical protein